MNIRSSVNGYAGNSSETRRKVAQSKRSGKREELIDAIVGGERVKLATKRALVPREKAVEIQIRTALAASGVMVMKHHVDNRGEGARTGLGLGVADLICVVPPYGRFLAIEVKRPGYTASDVRDVQVRWLSTVTRFGGVAGIASSVDEAMGLVALARGLP